MKTTCHVLAALACWSACGLAAAQAPSPASIESEADVADAGECEVEASFERSKARGEPKQRESALRLACGIGWHTELEATVARVRAGDEKTRAISLEAKTTLREREGDDLGWALALAVDAEREPGRGWRRSGERIEIEASRNLSATWLAEAKLGSERDRASRRRSTNWALSVEHAWSPTVDLKAELSGDDRSKPFVGLSWRTELGSDDVELKLSWAARTGTPREHSMAVSLQYKF